MSSIIQSPLAARLYFFILGASSLGLLLSIYGAVAGIQTGTFSNTLLFSLPVLWVVWIVLAILECAGSIKKVILAWVVIDFFALALMIFLTSSLAQSTGPRGDDIALAIAFFPLAWPMILLSQVLPNGAVAGLPIFISKSLGLVTPYSDWLGMSLLSIVPSVLLVAACRFARASNRVKHHIP